MGDTGSMIIGFFASVMTVFALSLPYKIVSGFYFPPQNLPFLLVSVLFIPLFDTFRVIIVRLIQRKHPFHADRQHIHHIFLDYFKCSHLTVSLVLGILNISLIVLFTILLDKIDQTMYFTIIFSIMIFGFVTLKKMSKSNLVNSKKSYK